MTRLLAFVLIGIPLLARAASSPAPADFLGHWQVSRMVGASDIGTGADFHKRLGSKLEWTTNAVNDADGVCRLAKPAVTPISRHQLEHDLWGGQTIDGLILSKTDVAKAFNKPAIPVFDDGGQDCARAVMLDRNRILLMFANGYLYLLERVPR